VFKGLNWHEETVSSFSSLPCINQPLQTPFTADTPVGSREFTNLIYTFDPSAPRKLVISAHFDSVYHDSFPMNQFIGATDAASCCAMMLSLAEFITPLLSSRAQRVASGQSILRDGFDEEELARTTLQLVFFDGEEAFQTWTDTDSIYGSRHLAELWEDTFMTPSDLAPRRMAPQPTVLESMDVLVLLDLLGNSQSTIYSFYRETDWLHDMMRVADQKLKELGLVEIEPGAEQWFPTRRMPSGMIEDDHTPVSVSLGPK
jgi:glutaminyl-peptide cyclotransferase